jgi:hypothetical protein
LLYAEPMRFLFWTTLLLSVLLASCARADECEAKAAQIADRIGLDAGPRGRDNSIALSTRSDEEDAYGVYLLCKGSLGMTLRYLSPPSPGPKWYDFVGRSGAILTGIKPASVALEARNCIENARLRDGVFRPPGTALRIQCSMSKNDARADLSIAAR